MTSNIFRGFCGLVAAALFVMGIIGCGHSGSKIRPTAETQYREAMIEYQKKHYVKAVTGFQKVTLNFSGAPMVDSAQFYLAMSYFQQGDHFMAASEFERLVTTYPGSPFVSKSQYMMGLCTFKATPSHYGLDQEDLMKAISALEDFLTDYPESEFAGDARATIKLAKDRLARKRYEAGLSYFKLGYYESAAIYFQKVIDEYTDSEWAARALYYQGEIDYHQDKFQDARNIFNNFLIVYPSHEFSEKARKMLAKIDKDLAESAKKD